MVKRYICGCGSEMNYSNFKRHLKTRKHQAWEEERNKEECGVCYELKIDSNSVECEQCRHKLCQSCYQRLPGHKRCPFCRKYYEVEPHFHVYFGNQMEFFDMEGLPVSSQTLNPDMLGFIHAMIHYFPPENIM